MDELKKEHGQFVSKVKTLDPTYEDVTPWELRSYRRKRSMASREQSMNCSSTGVSSGLKSCDSLAWGSKQNYKFASGTSLSDVSVNAKSTLTIPTKPTSSIELPCSSLQSHCQAFSPSDNPLKLDYSSSDEENGKEMESSQKKLKIV